MAQIQGLTIDDIMVVPEVPPPPAPSVAPEGGKHAPPTAAPPAPAAAPSPPSKEPDKTATGATERSAREARSEDRAQASWEEVNRAKEQVRLERERLEIEREQLARAKAELLPAAKKAEHTADDYERFAKEFDEEGRDDLAERARERAQSLRQTARAAAAEAAQARVRNAQQDYLREELRKDPTLGDPKTALYQDVERLLLSRPVLQTYPEGLRDAVEHVRALHASRRVADLESELGKTKESLAAKEKLLHPSTGEAPAGASGEPKSFGQLPYEERRKRILAELAAAEEHGVSVL